MDFRYSTVAQLNVTCDTIAKSKGIGIPQGPIWHLFILHNHHAICINCKNSWLEQLNRHATTNTEGVVKCPSCRKSCHLQIPDIANIKLQQLLRMLPMGNRHRSNLDQRIWGQRYRFPPMEFLWVRIHWKIHWMMSPYMIDIVRSE